MHQGIAFRTAYLLTGSAADAEDAVQVGFVKAWAALSRYRRGAPFKPWLLRIVANEAHNRRRSSGRANALRVRAAAEQPLDDAVPSPEGAALGHEQRTELLAAVQRLESRARPRRSHLSVLPRVVGGRDGRRARRASRHRQVAHFASARSPEAGDGLVSEIEKALTQLGREVAIPAAPDVVPAVLARLESQRAGRPRRRRGVLVAARPRLPRWQQHSPFRTRVPHSFASCTSAARASSSLRSCLR